MLLSLFANRQILNHARNRGFRKQPRLTVLIKFLNINLNFFLLVQITLHNETYHTKPKMQLLFPMTV